jgi:ubiquinone/menaquinone biosynthesis C-methylase UbiE
MVSLDVGCGKSKRGDIGIDYSKRSDADVIADSHFLPFRDGAFNSVTSFVVLEHSPNPLIFLKEQYRVLKPNGKVTVVTDNAQYFRVSVLSLGLRGVRHEDYCKDHYMIFFPENVKRLMRLAGFRVDSFAYISKKGKGEFLAQILVKAGLWRSGCIYWRFQMEGTKLML